VDAAHALAGPSFSQFNESYTSVYLKEFQTNGNVKLHSMQRNSQLKKDMIIHKDDNVQLTFSSQNGGKGNGPHGYQMSRISNMVPVSKEDRSRMKHELIVVKATDSEMSLDEIRGVEMNR
ncbi:hypothetical protein AVEN_86132-1, partial [Araneus ventricosus]